MMLTQSRILVTLGAASLVLASFGTVAPAQAQAQGATACTYAQRITANPVDAVALATRRVGLSASASIEAIRHAAAVVAVVDAILAEQDATGEPYTYAEARETLAFQVGAASRGVLMPTGEESLARGRVYAATCPAA
jgi:hypothetical protein